MSDFSVTVILPAAGKSTRFNDKVKKPFANLAGRAVFLHTAELFVNREDVKQIILAVHPEDYDWVKTKFGPNLGFMGIELVKGGLQFRWETVKNALQAIDTSVDLIAIHDAVRPCLTQEKITEVFKSAQKHGAAILANPISGTVKRVQNGVIAETIDRTNLYEAQTPQVFKKDIIIDAYDKLDPSATSTITDDAQVVELAGHKVHIVASPPTNIKITVLADLKLAEAIQKILPKPKPKGPIGPYIDDMFR